MLNQALINPVPYESAGENVMFVDDIPVVAKIARAVAHRV
jgi:hypothetical protein